MSNPQENKNEGQGRNKEFTIFVNTRQKMVTQREMSYSEIVALADDLPPAGTDTLYTVTYRRGNDNKPQGTLEAGQSIKIKEGMIFNVTATNRS